jgi:hypothetical protein
MDVPDRRLAALDDFLAAYEAEQGEISEQEMSDAIRRARANALMVRGRPDRSDPSDNRGAT